MATIQSKTLSISHNGNTYVIRGLTSEEVTKLTNAITQHQDISGKLNASLKGAAGGLAELDSNGKVPSSQLPSYVDDVVEVEDSGSFPQEGEAGKIYINKENNKTYRWSGSTWVLITGDVTLGETSSTAYRGDRGAAAYAHAVTNKGSAFASGLYKITTNSEGHVTAATAVAKSDIISLGIADIPAITVTDNGKIPVVSNGAWALQSILGETSSTAYRGDRGAAAYAHAVTNKGSAFASGLYKITTNSEGHVTAATAVVKADITGLGIAELPAVSASDNGKVLGVSDGVWAAVTSPAGSVMTGATVNADGTSGLVPAPTSSDVDKFLKANGTWDTPAGGTNPVVMTGATASANGVAGYVPSPTSGQEDYILLGGGSWADPGTKFVQLSGSQTVGGTKTFSANINVQHDSATYRALNFKNGAGNTLVSVLGYTSTAANIVGARFYVREYSAQSTATTSGTGYYEAYRLPACTANLSANATYEIITTKDVDLTIAGVKTFSDTTASSSTGTGAVIIKGGLGVAKYIYGSRLYNGVWNDYAECRSVDTLEPGLCVVETKSGMMTKSWERLMPGCKITSDTYGNCMGETDEAKTPIAVAGRVLVHPYRDVSEYHLGDAVCSAPDGKVDIMTREEIREYPERIVGTVSEIPSYDVWYGGTKDQPNPVRVNGRIWVYVR